MEQHPDTFEGHSDDLSIVQGLLGRPKIPRKESSFSGTPPHQQHLGTSKCLNDSLDPNNANQRRRLQSSNTWTTSSGEILSDQDEIEDRDSFLLEYNRLARKHGVRVLNPDDYGTNSLHSSNLTDKSAGWFSRKVFRRSSSTHNLRPESQFRHKRSISDLSLRLRAKKDTLKDKDLQELVRLCGSSLLYLPSEYAACSLAVPTCFRATAQYLVQHGSTARGIFRIPGSHTNVAALYNHYCSLNEDGDIVAGTVRCPTLPEHIKCDVHDIASAFKKFLSGIPGGILGSLPLFDAFVSIHTQMRGDPEITRTKQSKIRARLIALAIGTLRSQYRRELICAVFGLLSMIGRSAETARREDERGRPLPTSDLMGYGPLGIVFGPLLIGDMMDHYTMHLASPHSGLVLLPINPLKSRKEKKKERDKEKEKEKRKKGFTSEDGNNLNLHVDKIKVANSITEMLITHWRDVVSHMKNLKILKTVGGHKSLATRAPKQPFLRPSASESFAIRKPPDWENGKSPRRLNRSESPTPTGRRSSTLGTRASDHIMPHQSDVLVVKKQRLKPRPISNQRLSQTRSMSILSPTVEEQSTGDAGDPNSQDLYDHTSSSPGLFLETGNERCSANAVKSIPIRNAIPVGNDYLLKRSNFSPATPTSSQTHNQGAHQQSGKQITHSLPRRNTPDGNQMASSVIEMNLPDITLPKGISRSVGRVVSGHVRRMIASEPAQPCLRPTKSVFGKSRRKKAWTVGANLDPLNRVSPQEDLASLAALAQALLQGDEGTQEASNHNEVRRKWDRDDTMKQADNPQKGARFARKDNQTPCLLPRPGFFFVPKRRSAEQNSPTTGTLAPDKSPPLVVTTPKNTSENFAPGSRSKTITSDHFIGIDLPNAHQQRPNEKIVYGTPRGTVRALAARFNTKDESSRVASPSNSPLKASVIESPINSKHPKGSLVAPYTRNSPSPTKSQKSVISEKSVPPSHNQLVVDRHITNPIDSSPDKTSTPRRLLRSSLNNSRPLRPACNLSEETVVGGFDTGNQVSDSTPAIAGFTPSASPNPPRSTDGPSNPDSSRMAPPSESVEVIQQVLQSQSDVSASIGTVNAVRSHPFSTSALSCRKALCPGNHPLPSRNNSLLHGQVRNLQRQLASKLEEIRQLQEQLETRESLEARASHELLREAKKEIQFWKSRAEVAERQIEIMSKLSVRRTSQRKESFSVRLLDQSNRSNIKCSEDGSFIPDRFWPCQRGMNGATRSEEEVSEESSNTVVQDIQEAVGRNEYGRWEN